MSRLCILMLTVSLAADDIEVVRDTWGVPHIFADSEADAFYGLGWIQAEDRGFQMQLKLRIMQGRLAELLGPVQRNGRRDNAVDHDRMMRTIGWARHAPEAVALLDGEQRALLQAYCDGVNAWFAAQAGQLPEVWAQLGLAPQAWTPEACLLMWWHMARFFGPDGTRDLNAERGRNNPRRPAPRIFQEDSVAVVQRDDVDDGWLAAVDALLPQPPAADSSSVEGPRFSHAWALGVTRNQTGAPILVSDPRTPVSDPPLFHEFHLAAGALDVRGIGTSGCPLILIGFNRQVAWGATALGADQADLFRLRSDAAHPEHYLLDGAWQPYTVIAETLAVRGRADIPLRLRQTVHGPVATGLVFARPEDGDFALRRVPLDAGGAPSFAAGLAMMRAENAGEFLKALRGWRFPSMNCVFADASGSIGYSVAGALPLRDAPEGGRLPLDGSVSDGWRGFIPGALLPHVLNPARDVLFSANHRPVGSFYRPYIGHSTGSAGETSRSWRLRELLAGGGVLSFEDVLAVQRDTVNPARRIFAQLGQVLLARGALAGDAAEAAAALQPWLAAGARSDLREPGAALAGQLSTAFRMVGAPLAEAWGGGESGLARCLKALSLRMQEDPEAGLSEQEQAFVVSRLEAAWRQAQSRWGADPEAWQQRAWDEAAGARLPWQQSLDAFPSVAPRRSSVRPQLFNLDGQTLLSQPGQTYTQIVPLADVDSALSLLPVGASEWSGSAGREASLRAWADGRLHPAPLSREAVMRHAAASLRLER